MKVVSSLDNGRLLVDEEGGQLQEGGSVNDVIATDPSLEKDIKSSWRMLAPFLLLVCLVPVLAFKLTAMGSQAIRSSSVTRDCSLAGVYPIIAQKGDTCWDLAQGHSLSLDELNDLNEDMNCEKLSIGEVICLKNPLKT